MEAFYPLRVYVCDGCYLMQLSEYVAPEQIFGEYAYFSSYADSWVAHARQYVQAMTARLGLDGSSLVVEVGSNDGYLLLHFAGTGIPVLGIEPAANVAAAAEALGIPTMVRFFGRELALELVAAGSRPALIVGNNVLAQVPDLNDFVSGLAVLLAPDGLITLEFPHVLRLLDENQFDTIYHEHFSYFSLLSIRSVMERHDLRVVGVEELGTHGGSLRVHVRHAADGSQVAAGRSIGGYGAPCKANTLLNYCGIRTDFVTYTVDRNPYKQGRYTPGTHIPILHPDRIREHRPDYVWILPWNLRDEIAGQLSYVHEWGGHLMVASPRVEVRE